MIEDIADLDPENGIEWITKEYPYTAKDSDWYGAVMIIAIGLAISSIIFGNYIFAILILVGTFNLLLYATKKPREIEVALTIDGIYMGEIFYPYKNLESFNIDQDHVPPRLILKSRKKLAPLITVEIEEVNENEVGDYLALFLDEDEELVEPIFFKLMEKIGF